MAKRQRRRDERRGARGAGDDAGTRGRPTSSKPVDRSVAARAAAGRRTQRRRTNVRLATLAGAILVPAIAVVFLSGALEPQVGIAAQNEGGVGVHLAQGAVLANRNRPPSSGAHYPATAPYGASSVRVEPGNWIHNLEHGAIAVLYRCADSDACTSISNRLTTEVINVAEPASFGVVKIVGTPYDDMDSPITAVAWGRELPLESFDAAQILAFYDRYVGRGPEQAP